MAFVNTIEKYGDEVTMTKVLERTLDEYTDALTTRIKDRCFIGFTSLRMIDVPSVATIGPNAFEKCSALVMLILRNPEIMVTLSNTDAFKRTPIASGTGYIYVPRALVDSYKAATNWSTYADQFRALEDYTVDGTTTGELDETKIAA